MATLDDARRIVDNALMFDDDRLVAHDPRGVDDVARDLAPVAVTQLFDQRRIVAGFAPFGMAPASAGVVGWLIGLVVWTAKLLAGAALLGLWEVSIAKMRVFRLPDFVGIAFIFGFLAILLTFLTRGVFS